jgi:hypothetical protein
MGPGPASVLFGTVGDMLALARGETTGTAKPIRGTRKARTGTRATHPRFPGAAHMEQPGDAVPRRPGMHATAEAPGL